MSGWRFFPLADATDIGLLAPQGNGKPQAAIFLTPKQAKSLADRRRAA